MLLNFSFENFKSFKEKEEFSMVAADTPKGPLSKRLAYDEDRVINTGNAGCKLLPVTAIFGGNAFGKSNFVEALRLFQILVLEQAKDGAKIPVSPFFLDPETKNQPTTLNLHIISGGSEYKIFARISKTKVIEERVSITTHESDEDIYHRKGGFLVGGKRGSNGGGNFNESINNVFENLSETKLLLSSDILQRSDQLKPVYNWFKEVLVILTADRDFVYVDNHTDLALQTGEALRLLGTGVDGIHLSPARVSETSLMQQQISELKNNIDPKGAAYFFNALNDMFLAKFKNGKISVESLNIVKRDRMLRKILVNTRDESNGTHRLLRILPAILQLGVNDQSKVLVVDEFDRSLHSKMSRKLVEYHLNNTVNGSHSQFIFTTHNVELINDFVFRKDEIWIVEKHHDGTSEMICLHEFDDPKKGMSFQKLYKMDSLGGTPNIFLLSSAQLTETLDDLRMQSAGHS